MKRKALLSAVGAVVFFGLDSIHVRIGIWKATGAAGVPWWFVFVYFLGILAAAALLERVERIGRPAAPPRVWLDLGMFVALLAAHILFFAREQLLTAIVVAILGARLAFFRQPKDLIIAGLVAGLEASIEVALAKLGVFAYSYASLGPLPLWHLPFWAALALCIRGFFLAAGHGKLENGYGDGHAAARPNYSA